MKYESRTKPRPLKDQTVKAVPLDTCASCASSDNDTVHTNVAYCLGKMYILNITAGCYHWTSNG